MFSKFALFYVFACVFVSSSFLCHQNDDSQWQNNSQIKFLLQKDWVEETQIVKLAVKLNYCF